MFNGIDHYFPFIDDKIGLIANIGNPTVLRLHQLCKDFDTVMEEVPDNTTLKGGLNEITQYLKVADKIVDKFNFANGTSSFTNESAKEPPEVPDTSPIKTIKLCKQRKSLSDNEEEEEEAEGEKEGDGNQGSSEGVEKGKKASKPVGEEGEPPAKKRKWTANAVMNSVTVVNSLKVLLISISIYRQNTKLPGCVVDQIG